MARRRSVAPRNLSSCFGRPMRDEAPAARMTAANTDDLPGDGRHRAFPSQRAVLGGDHLCQDGHCDLLRRLRADIQTDWTVQASNLLFRQAGRLEPLASGGLRFWTADRADEPGRALQCTDQGRVIQLWIMAQDSDKRMTAKRVLSQIVLGVLDMDLVNIRESLARRPHAARVDDHHSEPASGFGESRQRDANVDRAKDADRRPGRVRVDEHTQRTGWAVGIADLTRLALAEHGNRIPGNALVELITLAQAAAVLAELPSEQALPGTRSVDHIGEGDRLFGRE